VDKGLPLHAEENFDKTYEYREFTSALFLMEQQVLTTR